MTHLHTLIMLDRQLKLCCIFSCSAGGESVSYLVLSPLARGLFARAISQSGTSLMRDLRTSQQAALSLKLFLKHLGICSKLMSLCKLSDKIFVSTQSLWFLVSIKTIIIPLIKFLKQLIVFYKVLALFSFALYAPRVCLQQTWVHPIIYPAMSSTNFDV